MREMSKEMEKVRDENNRENQDKEKESLDAFIILMIRIQQLPTLFDQYQKEIARLTREIGRLQELEPKYKREYDDMVKEHPDYPKRAADKIKKIQSPDQTGEKDE